jgi:hypothetical protein
MLHGCNQEPSLIYQSGLLLGEPVQILTSHKNHLIPFTPLVKLDAVVAVVACLIREPVLICTKHSLLALRSRAEEFLFTPLVKLDAVDAVVA